MKREEVIRLFPERIRKILQQAYWNPQGLQEIRLRAGKPLILWQDGQEYFVAEQGFLTRHRGTGMYRITGRHPKNYGDGRNIFPLCL